MLRPRCRRWRDDPQRMQQAARRSGEHQIVGEGVKRAIVAERVVVVDREHRPVRRQHATAMVRHDEAVARCRDVLRPRSSERKYRLTMGRITSTTCFVNSGSHFEITGGSCCATVMSEVKTADPIVVEPLFPNQAPKRPIRAGAKLGRGVNDQHVGLRAPCDVGGHRAEQPAGDGAQADIADYK